MKIKLEFDITTDEYKIINKILNEFLIAVVSNCSVYVFGSRAKNTARINSDLDLAIELQENKKLSSNIVIDLKEAFDNSNLTYSVDIIDLNNVSATFKELVNQEKKIFPLLRVTSVDMISNRRPKLRFKADDGSDYPDWEEKMLGEIVKYKVSTLQDNQIQDNSGFYPVYGATGFIKNINFYNNEHDYIGIVKDGAGVGRILYCKGFSSVLSTIGCLYSTQNSLKYIYYLISYINLDLYKVGSTIPHIYFKDYSKHAVLVSSIPEQQKIADFLTSVDDLITITKQQLELMKQYKQGIMQQIFSQQLRFKADDGSDYPDWEEKRLEELVDHYGGTALEQYVNELGEYKFISIGNYSVNGTYIDNLQRVKLNEKTATKKLNKNDLVMVLNDKTTTGELIGSTILIDEYDMYIYNQRSERIICHECLNPKFLWCFLNSRFFRKLVFSIAQGGTQIYVNFSSVKKLQIIFPSPLEQQKIADCLTSIDDSIQQQTAKLEQIELYKKSLLQHMMI